MIGVPKFLYVQPSLQEFVQNTYPRLKPFMSKRYLKKETLVVVSDKNMNFVDDRGVLYVHPSIFDKVQSSMFGFFSQCCSGVKLQHAAEILMDNLQKECA